MKRVFSLVLAFVMVAMLMAGCRPASTLGLADAAAQDLQPLTTEPRAAGDGQAAEPGIPAGIDRTIEVDSYPIDLATLEPVVGDASLLCFVSSYQTVNELDDGSTLVVTGTVESIEFFSQNGFAHTKIDLVVGNVIKGGIAHGEAPIYSLSPISRPICPESAQPHKAITASSGLMRLNTLRANRPQSGRQAINRCLPGDKVSIIISGGYISLKDYIDVFQYGFQGMPEESEWPTTYICENAPALGFPNPGDSYAYFLKDSQTYAGAYSTLNIDEGIFKGAADGSYSRINPYSGSTSPDGDKVIDSFTLDELKYHFGKQPTVGRPLP